MEIQTRPDIVLVKQAVKGRWPVREATKIKVVESIEKIVEKEPKCLKDHELQLLACRTLVQIDALNLKDEENKIRAQPKHVIHTNMTMDELKLEITEKLKSLGLDQNVSTEDLQKLLEHKMNNTL